MFLRSKSELARDICVKLAFGAVLILCLIIMPFPFTVSTIQLRGLSPQTLIGPMSAGNKVSSSLPPVSLHDEPGQSSTNPVTQVPSSNFTGETDKPVQHSDSGNFMWIEPSAISLSNATAFLGTRFNVTVWLNMTKSIFSYQIGLHYDRNVLLCTRAGYTGENSSQYFSGHASDMLPIRIDFCFMGNGSVLAGEALYDSDTIHGPRNASLIWIEFEILQAPSGGTLASKLDLNTEYPAETFVLDNNLNTVPFTPIDATYTFTP